MRPPRPITIAARARWNRLVRWWASHRLAEVRVIDPAPWRPPYTASMQWDAEAEQWSVALAPGWCESPTGDPSPTMRTLARLCRPAAERLGEEDREAMIEARLDESPRLLIPPGLWRAEGTDAVAMATSSPRPLPAEIADRGVLPPVTLRETETGLVQQIGGLATDRANAALARAVEIYVEHGREVVSLGAIAGAGAEIDFEVSFLPASPESPRIGLRREWPEEGEGIARWLPSGLAVAADDGIDRIRLATLWLTSPRGEREGSVPDARWRPWVEQRVSRNLVYEVTGPELRAVEPLRLFLPGRDLAGGIGAGIIDTLAGDLQSRAAELDARLAGTETSGVFVEI